jgi:serine/threonine-protein kinase
VSTAAARCSACHAPADPGQRFCSACGARLGPPAGATPGDCVGPYRLDREIARGGMGVVYNAYDERLERRVALKVLLGEFAEDREFRARFVQESRAAAALDHPHILPVFDAGEVDGTLYIASRLVDGEDLRQLLARTGPLEVDRALAIAAQVAGALDFAHGRGIVHRDVKPANLLLVASDDGEPEHAYLIDFGITTNESRDMRLTETGRFIGTPEYVSPEQVSESPVDGRADQYALACVLYHCLTGSSPFPRPTSVDVLHAHLHEAPPHPAAVRPDVPPALDAAIVRALAKHRERRFPSCRAFVAAARAGATAAVAQPTVIDATLPATEPDAPVPPARRRRRRALAGMAAALVVLLAAAGGAAALLMRPAHPSRTALAARATLTPTPKPTRTAVPSATPKGAATPRPTATATATVTPAPRTLVALHPDELAHDTVQLHGFSVSLPSDWNVVRRDESQPTLPHVVRRETELRDDTTGASLLIDVLTGYDVSPEANRDQLDASFTKSKPGYRRIAMSDYDLGGTRGYEWRYRYDDDGQEQRSVDVMFQRGPGLYAVRATGPASYADLAALARATAESVTPAPQPESTPAPEPDMGLYEGIGYQHSATGAVADDDYRVHMDFAGSAITVSYPDLDCRGVLVFDHATTAHRVYQEQINHGTCDRGGHWTIVTVSPTEIRATWSEPSRRYVVRAVLTR